jgi:hypothetical protein
MRNLFDQYKQPENRMTHALMISLDEDRDLLGKFIEWATDKPAPSGTLTLKVIEQSFPGEEELQETEESERGGLPDGCIHDGSGWALLIESKIAAPLVSDQLQRHRQSARKHDLTKVDLLALVVNRPTHPHTEDATVKLWTELYQWLKKHKAKSKWPGRLIAYMEVLEAKLPDEGYLKEGALTVFTGIPFGKETPYNYFEAKRLIRLLMDELRGRRDLERELGIDTTSKGRSAITGRDTTSVWDFLWLANAKDAGDFTYFPHLTVGIHPEYLHAVVIVPHRIRSDFRNNLIGDGMEGFQALFESILDGFSKSLGRIEGVAPSVELVQRRYPTQREEPFIDARLEFDLRTGFENSYCWDKSPKWQPQWLEAAYSAISNRKSNLQLAVGAKFSYKRCADVNSREILNHIAAVWLACKPLIRKMLP